MFAVGRRARRQLRRVNLGPYATGLLKRGLDHQKTKEWPGVDGALLSGMEYSASVGVMAMMESADINKRIDMVEDMAKEAKEEAEESSGMRSDLLELGAELLEARGEMNECRGAMMMMRNALTDAARNFEDQKREWEDQRDLLVQISSGLLRRVEALERDVGPGSVGRPIVIEDSEDSGNDGDMETAPGDAVSVWARQVSAEADNTLVGDPMVYELVPISKLARSK
jgi:hypothetical protein